MDKIHEQREFAKTEIKKCLNEYGRCAFIRPTGWGKTWTTASFVDQYKHVLYIYPSQAIKNTFLYAYWTLKLQEVKATIPHAKFLTYHKLRKLSKSELKKKYSKIDLIIVDECDILGAPETMRAMFDLLEVADHAHVLGATATPERQDMIDEIAIFFDDHVISDYSLHNAIQDNIIKKPYYCTGCFDDTAQDVLAKLKRKSAIEVDKASHKDDKKLLGAYFQAKQLECANFLKMENTIPEELDKAGVDSDYQKYIVFFSSLELLDKQSKQVKKWFNVAFPSHKVTELTITSATKLTRSNVQLLDSLVPRTKTIDLIYTCNMLNMGYHVSNITGIIMMRGTGSSHIFIQQLGRVLSTGSVQPGIVFDVVDNLHRPAIYQMCWDNAAPGATTSDGEVVTAEEIDEYRELVQKTSLKDENNRPVPLSYADRNKLIKLKKKINKIENISGSRSRLFTPEDFIISTRDATIRELIAKTVAEPVSMRCRQAWSRWKAKGGDDSIMTREFILSQTAPGQVPLPPFCKLKHVSVEAVLDEMGVV